MDDETYVIADFRQLPGQQSQTTTERSKVPKIVQTSALSVCSLQKLTPGARPTYARKKPLAESRLAVYPDYWSNYRFSIKCLVAH